MSSTTLVWGPKDADEAIDYSVDFTDRWGAGDAFASVTWTLDAGITSDSEPTPTVDSDGNAVASIFISGGTNGENYDVVCEAVTTAGRTLKQTVQLQVRAR